MQAQEEELSSALHEVRYGPLYGPLYGPEEELSSAVDAAALVTLTLTLTMYSDPNPRPVQCWMKRRLVRMSPPPQPTKLLRRP